MTLVTCKKRCRFSMSSILMNRFWRQMRIKSIQRKAERELMKMKGRAYSEKNIN